MGMTSRPSTNPELQRAIAANMRRFKRLRSERRLTPAAVAIVVMQGPDQPCVPVFQRTHTMSRHAGQMALPGGKLHAGESATECAVRELREELGLAIDGQAALGELDDFDTKSGFTMTPVVFWSEIETSMLRPSHSEVQRLFVLTVEELRRAVAAADIGGSKFSLRFPAVEMFAPTAAILYQFSELALDGRACRVGDFYQPPFTHR